jgi:transcriptional regulator with XRE-family HTH domain
MSTFGERLKAAFYNASNAEIARQMGLSEPAVNNYMGGRIPGADKLIQIASLTKCNLHWLITGEGSRFVSDGREFNLEYSIETHEDWRDVIDEWYEFEGRPMPMPDTMGASFMGGWRSFDLKQKVAAVTDFKNFLDLTFGEKK